MGSLIQEMETIHWGKGRYGQQESDYREGKHLKLRPILGG